MLFFEVTMDKVRNKAALSCSFILLPFVDNLKTLQKSMKQVFVAMPTFFVVLLGEGNFLIIFSSLGADDLSLHAKYSNCLNSFCLE